jgi:hypothetical protein
MPSPSGSSATPAALPHATSHVIAVDTDADSWLINLDPTTLAETAPGSLRPGDWPTSQVLSPDGTTIAFGTNDGTIIKIDPSTFTRTGVVQVLNEGPYANQELSLLSWPTSRLIIGLAQGGTAHVLPPGRLLLIDPVTGQIRREVALAGSAVAESAASDGTAVLLVGALHDAGAARLVTVNREGRVRSVVLPAVKAGWNTEADQQWPGLLVHGRTAYAVGEGESITTVDLNSLEVRTHRVLGLMVERILPLAPALTPGSGGIFRVIGRAATWIAPHELLITGADTFPADSGTRNQSVSHPATAVDTRTWRITETFHGASRVELSGDGRVFLAWTTTFVNGREVDGLVGMTRTGWPLWQLQLQDRYANLFDGRLILSHTSGMQSQELDVRTGQPIRGVGTWDHEYLIIWTLHGGMRVTPNLT